MMRNLLVGNGLNCQFDKTSYTAQQIVLRILKNCNREDFPSHIIVDRPYLLKEHLGNLFISARDLLIGKTDGVTVCSAEKESLEAFKEKYASKVQTLKMTDICFEDYYLLHDLLCHSLGIGNPDQYTVRESMRAAYLYAIYNDGNLNNLYKNYPHSFLDFLSAFDNIFTTNYDSNIESASGKSVIHLHGQFDCFSNVYDEKSFRNQMEDAPIRNILIDPDFFYLYCNAITTHCGAYKESMIHQDSTANQCITQMVHAYQTDMAARQTIESWLNEENQILKNLANAIMIKIENPALCFIDNYHYDFFSNLSGELEILGLSPWNDLHIIRTINESQIDKCIFYYHSERTCTKIKELLPNLVKTDRLSFVPSDTLWGK